MVQVSLCRTLFGDFVPESQWKSTADHMGEGNKPEEATVATILHVVLYLYQCIMGTALLRLKPVNTNTCAKTLTVHGQFPSELST